MPALVEAYLAWKHGPDDKIRRDPGDHIFHVNAIDVFGKDVCLG